MADPPDSRQRKQPGKSGRQIGAENVERLQKYINDLKLNDARLPSRNGKPDKSAIAVAAGFSRLTLYNNPEAIALLDRAIAEVGIEGDIKFSSGKTEHLQHQLAKRDRRVQRLEGLLAARTAENETLKKEKRELEEKLRQFSIYEEVMTSTGRKFRP